MKKKRNDYFSENRIPLYKRPRFWGVAILCLAVLGIVITLIASGTFSVYKSEYSSPIDLAVAYKDAIQKNDPEYIKKLPSLDAGSSLGKTVSADAFRSLSVTDVEIIHDFLRENYAYVELDISVTNPGKSSDFHAGVNPSWLWLKEVDGKWYVAGLTLESTPEKTWGL